MLKKLLVFAFLIVSLAAGLAVYFWQQAAELPDWYEPASVAAAAPEAGQATPPPALSPEMRKSLRSRVADARRSSPTGGSRELRLDEAELNALLRESLEARSDGRRALQATKAIRAELRGDRLLIGAVTDLERLQSAAENERERAAIRQLKRLGPWLRGRAFYLGVEGRPAARGGRLALEDMTVEIGRLRLAPEDLAARFGLENEIAEQDLTARLPDMTLENARVQDENLVLTLGDAR